MNIVVQKGYKLLLVSLLFFYGVVIFPMETSVLSSMEVPVLSHMEVPVLSHRIPVKSNKKVSIFDPHEICKAGIPWRQVVPGSIMITPDAKGCVMAEYGQVKRFLFANRYVEPQVIIEHQSAKKSFPIIAMAEKKSGELLIVSAANYMSSDRKRVAEYIVYLNGSFRVEKLDRVVQAISLDEKGKKLAIAGENSVVVVDLETKQTDEVSFKGMHDYKNWIVDIAVQPTGNYMIGVGNHNGIQLVSLSEKDNKLDACTIKQVDSTDAIRKIYYSNSAEFLYLTEDGKAKTIDLYYLLEVDNDQEVKGNNFAHSSRYDKVIADARNQIMTAHWTNHERHVDKIKVYRKNSSCIEKFVLEMPVIDEWYDYITEFGNREQARGHLLHVAIRGNCVIALTTDGDMHVWDLPAERLIYDVINQEKLCEKLLQLKSSSSSPSIINSSSSSTINSSSPVRKSRSNSRESGKMPSYHSKNFTMTDSDDLSGRKVTDQDELKDRKKTFSKIKLFTRSRDNSPKGKGSRENSPVRRDSRGNSRETSPVRSLNEEFKMVEDYLNSARKSEDVKKGGEEI